MVRLRRTSADMAGWKRIRRGKGFQYVDESGQTLPDKAVQRCRELAIPPAWGEVWICPFDNGHLQSVGVDDAGRRQYIYHAAWRVRRALGGEHLDVERVAAAAVSLLDLGMFRVGSERYVEENGSYGLTTLTKAHVKFEDNMVTFAYPGKSGQDVEVAIRDTPIVQTLRALRRRNGGERLFAYKSDNGWHDLSAMDVNAYLKDVVGEEHSVKEFRTWRGTTIAASALARSGANSPAARTKAAVEAMKEVSEHLGNTAAIAKSSYVDPRIVDLFHHGVTVSDRHRRIAPGRPVSRKLEREVLRLLRQG